jgi:hypothetical protein
LARAPALFTADAEEAEGSLRRISGISFDRLLTAHGAGLANGSNALNELVDRS